MTSNTSAANPAAVEYGDPLRRQKPKLLSAVVFHPAAVTAVEAARHLFDVMDEGTFSVVAFHHGDGSDHVDAIAVSKPSPVPASLVTEWPFNAADLRHIRLVLSQDSCLIYRLQIHEGDGVRPHAHVVFLGLR